MNQRFEEFKKGILDLLISIQERLEESSSYNLLKEKYQALPAFKQKIIKYGVGFLLLGLVLSFPLIYFFDSLSHEKEFKEKKALSLKLLRTKENPIPPFPQTLPIEMKKQISDVIIKYQKQNYTLKDKLNSQNRSEKLKKVSFVAQVNHLNIKQAIQLGTDLINLPLLTMDSLKIKENTQYENHYDTTYEVSFFTFSSFFRKPKPATKVKSKKESKKPKPLPKKSQK